MAQYFTKDTDAAITAFNESTDRAEKNKIFELSIKPAFVHLIDAHMYMYGFHNLDDADTLRNDCLTSLYELLPKFDATRGTKGFSYYNVVTKNWFIHKSREKSKRNKLESELRCDLDHEVVKRDPNFSISPHEDDLIGRERWIRFLEEMDGWRGVLDKKTERKVLEAAIFLMQNPDLVTIHNKKAIYLYLRELTGLETKQIVQNLNKIKELYSEWSEKFSSTGES